MILNLLLLSSVFAAPAVTHANSISVSRIDVDVDGKNGLHALHVRHEIELQTLSILEVLPELDLDGDGQFDESELEGCREPLERYLASHYAFQTGTNGDDLNTPRVTEIRESAAGDDTGFFMLQRITLVREFDLTAPPEDLSVVVSIFAESSPDHRDFCTLAWRGQIELNWLFSAQEPRLDYSPDPELSMRIARDFLARGARRSLDFTVLALVLALLIACPSARHSRTVGMLYLTGIVAGVGIGAIITEYPTLQLPARLLQLTAVLAVAYTAVENALLRAPRTPRLEAGLFGAVQGIILVQELIPSLDDVPSGTRAAAAFTVGLGASLLAISLILPPLLARLPGTRSQPNAPAPNWMRIGLSILLTVSGLVLFTRMAWFGQPW